MSRLHVKKGLGTLIEALARLVDRPWQLDILGGTADDDPASVALIHRHGLSDRIHFMGWLEGAAKWRALDAADLFVLPSASENFGLAVVEAMARGRPVLISPQIDIAPAIKAAGAGFIVPTDVAGLAEGLIQALSAQVSWPAMGVSGRQLVETQYSWPVIAERLAQAYENVIAGRAAL